MHEEQWEQQHKTAGLLCMHSGIDTFRTVPTAHCICRADWSPVLEQYESTAAVLGTSGQTLFKGLSAKVVIHDEWLRLTLHIPASTLASLCNPYKLPAALPVGSCDHMTAEPSVIACKAAYYRLCLKNRVFMQVGLVHGKVHKICPHNSTGRADYFGSMVNKGELSSPFGTAQSASTLGSVATVAMWS